MLQTKLLSRENLGEAALCLQRGGLVAFPTETVYGLGANALDPSAVAGIFAAKGRPADNPLIVHLAHKEALEEVASHIPPQAYTWAEAFWPGPLTMVFHARPEIPSITRGGLGTVGVRIPDHPLALELIDLAGLPIAAPSANLSGRPSPTTAEHVWEDLKGRIHIIVDGGPTGLGLESTVVDLTTDPPVLLRPGGLPYESLAQLGPIELDPGALAIKPAVGPVRSPGMKYTHYAPRGEVYLVEGQHWDPIIEKVQSLAEEAQGEGRRVGILGTSESLAHYRADVVLDMGPRAQPELIAQRLFHCLRSFDGLGVEVIIIEGIPAVGIGLAVMNRLRKAAGYNIIQLVD
ncbi:MAG: L-threonylcarbamoyladenylate synthase [Limnochordia bacterium]|jgi:L-threonylcarbamoyladenylate synthase